MGDGPLNDGCGAEWVQKGRTPPRGAEAAAALGNCARACSLDGDADRIVFHYYDSDQGRLLDGDKIAALCVSWVSEPRRFEARDAAHDGGGADRVRQRRDGVYARLPA